MTKLGPRELALRALGVPGAARQLGKGGRRNAVIDQANPVTIKPKRGRPPSGIKKPWVDAGMSRASWYRRKRRNAEKKNAKAIQIA
jgi:hypothetical protein